MLKIDTHTVQRKHTGEKFGSEKIIVQYLIRIVQRGNLAKKNNRTCTIIRYPKVRVSEVPRKFPISTIYNIKVTYL